MADGTIPDYSCYEGSKILVTGGTGYIGSTFIQALSKLDCDLMMLSRREYHLNANTQENGKFRTIVGDISDRDIWAKALAGVDYVFHLAAQTSGSVARQDPVVDLNINILPAIHMLEVCKTQDIMAKIVFAGTTTQVGLTDRTPVDETFPDNPITIYDMHKLAVEKYLQYYAIEHEVPTVTLRLSNVYGPGPSSEAKDRGVLNQMVRRGLDGDQLSVYGKGTFIRDYIYIDDVVSALLLAGSNIKELSGNYYVIGTGVGIRFVDAVNLVADKAANHIGIRPPVIHVEPPPQQSPIEERSFVANPSLFKGLTGWQARVNLDEGLDFTIDSMNAKVNSGRDIRDL